MSILPVSCDKRQSVEEIIAADQWGYEYAQREHEYGRNYLLPWLKRHGITPATHKLAVDLGCGFGGIAVALAETGMNCAGLDVSERALNIARAFSRQRGLPLSFYCQDLNQPLVHKELSRQKFDLILLRDVVEHVPNLGNALEIVWQIMAPDGLAVVEFPPYYSAFGGHQHYRRHPLLRLPFMHLPPMRVLFRVGALTRHDEQEYLEEIRVLEECKLSLRKFERLITRQGFKTLILEHYLIRPIFSMRFGLPTLRLPGLGRIPYLRELLVTGVIYVLQKPQPGHVSGVQ